VTWAVVVLCVVVLVAAPHLGAMRSKRDERAPRD
jgi:hypothetical protein